MRKIRVLLIDDAVVVRQLITAILSEDPEIEVVGTAPNGKIALVKLVSLEPDLVISDIEMPEMNGLEVLVEIRKRHPRLPVIMFSSLTERGAVVTLEALALGATDYVTKPASLGNAQLARQRVREDLVPKIKALCPQPGATPPGQIGTPGAPFSPFSPPREAGSIASPGLQPVTPAPAGPRPSPPPRRPSPASPGRAPLGQARVDVVAIGISTGGPNALAEMLPQLPADFPVPLVIVQHMPPIFTKHLADRLASKSRIAVGEGAPGDALCPGKAFIAPGNFHMALCRDGAGVRLQMNQNQPENSCRPAADVLFRSVAEIYGARALALVMTGMGQDGLKGCACIREAGGQIVVQDEQSSVVWGMPGMVANAGLAERVLPLHQLGAEVLRRVAEGRPFRYAAPMPFHE